MKSALLIINLIINFRTKFSINKIIPNENLYSLIKHSIKPKNLLIIIFLQKFSHVLVMQIITTKWKYVLHYL